MGLDYVAPAPSIPPPSIPPPPQNNHAISAPIIPVSYQHAIVAPIMRAHAKRLSQILLEQHQQQLHHQQQQEEEQGDATNRATAPNKTLPDPRLQVPIVQKSKPGRATIHQILANAFPRPKSDMVVQPKAPGKPVSFASSKRRRNSFSIRGLYPKASELPPTEEVSVQPPIPFESLDNLKRPKVLIAGAGLGGLTLAILLHKAKIPFKLFERAREVKPLGSALSLGAGIAPLFKQMGIYDEFLAIAKPYNEMRIFNDKLKPEYTMDCSWGTTDLVTYPPPPSVGYPNSIVSRPDLYELLWRHVPKESVFLDKRVVNFEDDAEGVLLRCADGTSYQGDVLIGADGAYSAVRSHLYKVLKAKGLLPDVDDTPLPFHTVSLVGQTEELDPNEFPDLNMELCQVKSVLGSDNMCTWITLTTKKNTVCWMVIQYLSKSSSKSDDRFCNSEWGPEATEAMCNEVRQFKVPGTDDKVLTLGDYIDRTPKELIVKVMLEEKVFDT
ncbi:hypothetical protein CPC16_002845, partial [Podila verticillata]